MIEKGAIVHPGADIHPTAIIRAGAIIGPNVTIEENVHVGHYSTIGMWAEYHNEVDERKDSPGYVIIGNDTIIREYVSVHGSAKGRDWHTFVGAGCYLQAHCHIGHDALLLHEVTVACHAVVAGGVEVHPYCNLGLHATTHQNAVLKRGTMLGAGAFFKGETPQPFRIYAGVPAKDIGPNQRLMDKLGVIA